MEQHFYVLFDPDSSAFYQDSQFGMTTDMLRAEHYNSEEDAKNELKYFKDDIYTVRKVTVKLEE